jgi:hypothetical protein
MVTKTPKHIFTTFALSTLFATSLFTQNAHSGTQAWDNGACPQINLPAMPVQVIVAIDVSESFSASLPHAKAFAQCIFNNIRANDTGTLVIFAKDKNGTIEEISTFSREPGLPPKVRNSLDLVQIGEDTNTYFSRLADYINLKLETITEEPFIVVLTDGKSDGTKSDRLSNLTNTIFVGGDKATSYQIGVLGSPSVLQSVAKSFKAGFSGNSTGLMNSGIPSYLLNPTVHILERSSVTLSQQLFGGYQGQADLFVRTDLVTRHRAFEIVSGEHTLATSKKVLVGASTTHITLDFNVPSEQTIEEVQIRMVSNTRGTLAINGLTDLPVQTVSLRDQYGMEILFSCVFLIVALVLMFVSIWTFKRKRKSMPVYVSTDSSEPHVQMRLGESLPIGGAGGLNVRDYSGPALADIRLIDNQKRTFTITVKSGNSLCIDGVSSIGSEAALHSGGFIEIESEGQTYGIPFNSSRKSTQSNSLSTSSLVGTPLSDNNGLTSSTGL